MSAKEAPKLLFPPRRNERRPGCFRAEGLLVQASGRPALLAPAFGPLRSAGIGLALIPGDGCSARGGQPSRGLIDRATAAWVRLLADAPPESYPQAFCMVTDESGIILRSGGPPGLLYGLLHLAEAWDGGLEAGTVADWPAISNRCVLLDVSRARVPRLSFLREFVDLIAALRFNQLTFNLEHVLLPPGIDPGEDEVITPEELGALNRHCRDRGVEYIPFQQSLGHLRGILSRPEHRGLAYNQAQPWSLDPGNEAAYELLGRLYDQQLAVTDSAFFHAGCDEPFDMIRNFDPARFGGRSREEVVVDHVARVARMLTERGRKPMVWSDALSEKPELAERLPADLILCHWHYGTGNREGVEHYRTKLTHPGRPFYACASTWSFVKLFPDLALVRASNDGMFTAAKERGPLGMMTTIWGDLGHMNLPGLEVYPLAYAARHGWSPAPAEDDPGPLLSRLVYGGSKSAGALPLVLDGLNRALNGPFGMGGVPLPVLLAEPFSFAPLPAGFRCDRAAGALETAARYAAVTLSKMETEGAAGRRLWLDHHLTVVQAEYLAKKFQIISVLREAKASERPAAFRSAADRCGEAAAILARGLGLLESRWLVNHKRSGFDVNLARWRRLIQAWRDRQQELLGYSAELSAGRTAPETAKILSTSPTGYNFDLLAELGLKDLIG